jgi:hypothetical protein
MERTQQIVFLRGNRAAFVKKMTRDTADAAAKTHIVTHEIIDTNERIKNNFLNATQSHCLFTYRLTSVEESACDTADVATKRT